MAYATYTELIDHHGPTLEKQRKIPYSVISHMISQLSMYNLQNMNDAALSGRRCYSVWEPR